MMKTLRKKLSHIPGTYMYKHTKSRGAGSQMACGGGGTILSILAFAERTASIVNAYIVRTSSVHAYYNCTTIYVLISGV